ncbi:cache domain-containing protein [Undibacterium sp.]|uniref:cache domain-containing protein n=1 Tax=Undibacterium sp. TaxID=1914977 RepID=UPI00374C899A
MNFSKIILSALCMIFSVSALAAGKADDAVAIVDKGLAYLQKNGKAALITEVNNKNPLFIKGDVYLALRALDGTTLAHPINPRVVGKNMIILPDADGKFYRKEIVEIAKSKGKGWVNYRYNNPDSNELEDKATYFVRSGDMILEAGIYKLK